MSPEEREIVVEGLKSSEARLLELTDGLTPRQWDFREEPDRWSTAEIIEHVIVFENFLVGVIRKLLEEPAEPNRRIIAQGKDSLVLGLAHSRQEKITGREATRPNGRWTDTAAMLSELRRVRAETIAFALEIDAELRDYFFKHVSFGDLDCYQWMILLGQHSLRHAFQIEQIRRHPDYPAS